MRLNERTRAWLPWLLLALALLATALVYWPGVTGGWVFDDYPNIIDNAAIHITPGHSTLAAWVNAALSSPSSFLHRPLASITFAINWYFGEGDPRPFKITNILIHLANGVLLYCMLRALLRLLAMRGHRAGFLPRTPVSPRTARASLPAEGGGEKHGDAAVFLPSAHSSAPLPPPSARTGIEGDGFPFIDGAAATRLALVVSAAWLLLPINLLAVLYVVQRMESLCQIFVLAGLWAYLHGRWIMLNARDTAGERRGLSLAATGIVLGTVLGLTSKETAVLLPVFAFLAEALMMRFQRSFDVSSNGAGTTRRAQTDSGFRPAAGPGMTMEGSAGPGTTSTQEPARHSGAARSAEPGIGLSIDAQPSRNQHDKRLWALFTITLFTPATLGFLWLLRKALRATAFAGRDFTLAQRLLTEPRVLVDYLHWTLLPNPEVLSLYHDEIVKSTGLLTPWTTLGAMVLLAALVVIAVLLRNRLPLVALGIGWFFAAQLLTATIVPLELVYEQRMYFASIGVLLAVGVLLLGRRRQINWALLRGFIVAVALLWFGTATTLRALEWSNPLRLAVAEANRHPESPRAVYEAGRLLLIAANYQPGKALDESEKYLRQAAAIPSASALADQALIMLVDHQRHGDDGVYWKSMIAKLRTQPTRQEDMSALISLTNCYGSGICKFDLANLQDAYTAALSRPYPNPRLYGAYAAFQRDLLHDDMQAEKYLALAVRGSPSEPAYRVDLAALYARNGQTEQALEQIDALRRMNIGGRLDGQITLLERLAEQGKTPTSPPRVPPPTSTL